MSVPNVHALPYRPEHASFLVSVARHALEPGWPDVLDRARAMAAEVFGTEALYLLQSCPDGRFEALGDDAEVDGQSPPAEALRIAKQAEGPMPLDAASCEILAGMLTEVPTSAAASEPTAALAEDGAEAPRASGVVIPVVRAKYYALVVLRARPFDRAEQMTLKVAADLLVEALRWHHASHALRRREAQTRAILRTSVDGIITIDERGALQSMNPAAERIFGYAAEEILGCNVKVLMPSPYHEEHDGYLSAYHETGRRRIIGIGREVSGRRKDGTTFPMELSVSEVRGADGTRTFTGLVRDISARRELEAEVLRIADEERRRIGQDLHDGLGQMLTGTHLIARGLTRQLEADGSERVAEAKELAGLIKEADGYARALARGLVPVELEAHGLAAALKRLAANAERLFGIACACDLVGSGAGDIGEAPEVPAATHLFRIAQEAVSNAVQHGQAQRVTITLAVGAGQVRLRVDDDGIGIDQTHRAGGNDASPMTARDTLVGATTRPDENRGMGIRIMHYRARIAQGSLELRPGASGGTSVLCTVPLP